MSTHGEARARARASWRRSSASAILAATLAAAVACAGAGAAGAPGGVAAAPAGPPATGEDAAVAPVCPTTVVAARAPDGDPGGRAPERVAVASDHAGLGGADLEAALCLMGAETQMEMNACARAEASRAEARLSAAYAAAIAAADAEAGALLRDARQAFVDHRERQCALRADAFRGGSLAPLEQYACVAELSWAHLDALARYLERLP
jgi:uncharacterized protein YecT (DUF1311 family)